MNQNDIVCIAVGRKARLLGVFGIQITETGAAHIHSENFECSETLEPEDTLKKLQATWELIQNEPDAPPEDQMRVSEVTVSDGTVYHPPFSRLEEIWTKEIIKQWMSVHRPNPCGPDSWVRSLQKNSPLGMMGVPMMMDVPTADGKTVRLPITTPWSEIEKIASHAYVEQYAQAWQKKQEEEAGQWITTHPAEGFGPDSWVRSLQKNSPLGMMGVPMMMDVPTADGKTVRLPVVTPWSEIEKIASPAFLEQCAQARQKKQEEEAAEREARKNRPPLPYVCADGTWCCVCGKTGITAKYCINCGSEKP